MWESFVLLADTLVTWCAPSTDFPGRIEMSILLGVELAGAEVRLVVVDRRATVLSHREEPLATPVLRWWETHPEERYRAVLGLISQAIRDGVFRPPDVAGIGITSEPALVLLDPDLLPVPPRDLPWEERDPEEHLGDPWGALASLYGESPRALARIGSVLDLTAFIRFRLTGALASHVDFAWSGGFVLSAAAPTDWDFGALDNIGLLHSQLPPIFPAPQKVSVVGEDAIRQTGLRRGTWVAAGGDPLNTRLLFAAQPLPETQIVHRSDRGVEGWEVVDAPAEWSEDYRPSGLEGIYFRRMSTDERVTAESQENTVFDWDRGVEPVTETWPESRLVAADAGQASSGTAILTGLGLGWWRDPRPIWRKRRPPQCLSDRRAAEAASLQIDSGEEMRSSDG